MLPNILAFTICCAVIATTFSRNTSHAATFMGLGDLDGGLFSSSVQAISADGLFTFGGGVSSIGPHAFRWSETAGLEALGFSGLNGASADGSTIVGMQTDEDMTYQGFYWQADQIVSLGDVAGSAFANIPWAASRDGRSIVGVTEPADGPLNGFLWTATTGIALLPKLAGTTENPSSTGNAGATDVSDDGTVIVGYSSSANSLGEAVRWINGVNPQPLESGTLASASAVSGDGKVIVGWRAGGGGSEAFRWTEETGMIGIGDLAGGDVFAEARAVSDDGSVIVGAGQTERGSIPGLGREAFIWTEAAGLQSLAEVLVNDFGLEASLRGWTLGSAVGISADGSVIVGNGINPAGESEAWRAVLTPVPEPATLLTAFIGMAALVIVAAKRHLA